MVEQSRMWTAHQAGQTRGQQGQAHSQLEQQAEGLPNATGCSQDRYNVAVAGRGGMLGAQLLRLRRDGAAAERRRW